MNNPQIEVETPHDLKRKDSGVQRSSLSAQKQIPFPEQNNSFPKDKEEFEKNRNRIVNQIYNVKQTFSYGLKNIEIHFLNSYDIYLQNLDTKLKECDALIQQHIESQNIKSKGYSQINLLLQQMLEEKISNITKYINDVSSHTQKLLDLSAQDDFSKANDIIKTMIQEQINEKQREEENRKIKENELKQKSKEDILIDKPMKENILKRTNQGNMKIEINGEIDINENINLVESSANLNYTKIVFKKIKKEYLQLLLSQSNTFKTIFHNKKDENEIINRVGSVYSMGGEAAPDVNNIPINKILPTENENNKIKDISILDSNFEDIHLSEIFPFLENIKIINTKLPYKIPEKLNLEKLEVLRLEGIGLINENFNALFNKIRKNEIMRKNLRIFSIKNNNISFLDYRKGYADNILKEMTFNNLEVLDMSYNKLYLFQNQIFNSLEKIKLIDLTNNNIAFPTNLIDLFKASKAKKCLVLMTNNLAILKEKSNIEYNQYLIQILPEINYPIKKITLDNIFCNNSFQDIFQIDIGKFKTSLEYLDLSNGQLEDKNLISLLNEKWDFPNLKTFILESNYLTEGFIYSLVNKNYNFVNKLSKLKILNLSDNKINCSNVDLFKRFLESFKNLRILELKCTPIEVCINQFYRKIVMKYYDPDNKKQFEHAFNENEKKIEQILENNYLKENTQITISILDLINTKYTKIISTHFPHLLDRISMINKSQT